MARKRAPEHDYICIKCECPCDPAGERHVGGGQNMRACRSPKPMLRSEWEARITADAEAAVAAIRQRVG